MAGKNKYSPGKTGSIVDGIHIITGVVVCVLAVLTIFNPDRYSFLFPLIFLLAAALSFVAGWYTLISFKRNLRKRAVGIIYFVVGALLCVLFLVSAISLWFHN